VFFLRACSESRMVLMGFLLPPGQLFTKWGHCRRPFLFIEKGFATCYAARSGSCSLLVLLSGAKICRSSLEILSATFSGQSKRSE
jgi:hypothetical protein